MVKARKTRWYQSLTLRLLALFWFLLLGAAAAALYAAFYMSQPTELQPLSEDFERSLEPVFRTQQSGGLEGTGLLQPGRLLVGEYRVMARNDIVNAESDSKNTTAPHTDTRFAPALHQSVISNIVRLLAENESKQVPVGNEMFAGPFTIGNARIVVSRPLTADEVAYLALQEEQDIGPRVLWVAFVASGFGAFVLGFWFVRPLKKLRNGMREIAAGEAYPNLGRLPKRRDELGELARTLRTTALELATSRDAQRRLLSDVSHELRSPLARSQIALDLLGDESLRQNTHFLQLERDIYRLGSIIDSILWLSRLENGLDDPIRESVKPAELFKEIQSDVGYAQAEWGARLVLPTAKLPTIETDPVLLRLVLENLIRNGFQYGPEQGAVHLTVEQHIKGEHGKSLKMTVRDEGDGVDESKLEQLFKPFFRGDPSRHHGAGVGLGLALCQRATRVLDGTLTASNHPDGGLAVSLTVPIRAPQ
ncbi:sensor histidine kinase [Aliidiomarina celeris]|uniref:sensor histidine kinase n=1 Tax=Aliidiomarina celeris TaxID=2249428 RepID=UPI000DEBFED0|nr:HAMP domain-containing sensor histidine kinase [Aliidiomarina celeris]